MRAKGPLSMIEDVGMYGTIGVAALRKLRRAHKKSITAKMASAPPIASANGWGIS